MGGMGVWGWWCGGMGVVVWGYGGGGMGVVVWEGGGGGKDWVDMGNNRNLRIEK